MTYAKLTEDSPIILLEGFGNYTQIHYDCGKKLLMSYTLLRYEEVLTGFVRVSRKYLVNPDYIKDFKFQENGQHLVLKTGLHIKVPRRRKKILMSCQ